jgi:hypothetical protein
LLSRILTGFEPWHKEFEERGKERKHPQNAGPQIFVAKMLAKSPRIDRL